jgi:hypothetical protein
MAPKAWEAQAPSVLAEVRTARRVIFVTRNAWRDDTQREALLSVSAETTELTVVALRDPHDAMIVPAAQNALTYADDPSSIRAAVRWLLDGTPAPGVLPVALS